MKQEKTCQIMATESFKWTVGNGSTIRFWKDLWLGSSTLAKSFSRPSFGQEHYN